MHLMGWPVQKKAGKLAFLVNKLEPGQTPFHLAGFSRGMWFLVYSAANSFFQFSTSYPRDYFPRLSVHSIIKVLMHVCAFFAGLAIVVVASHLCGISSESIQPRSAACGYGFLLPSHQIHLVLSYNHNIIIVLMLASSSCGKYTLTQLICHIMWPWVLRSLFPYSLFI